MAKSESPSSTNRFELLVQSVDNGMFVLTKPFQMELVADRIREIIEN